VLVCIGAMEHFAQLHMCSLNVYTRAYLQNSCEIMFVMNE